MKEIIKNKIKIKKDANYPLTMDIGGFSLELEGEKITKCTPQLGFHHKGFEKAAEGKLFTQYIPIAEKIDFLSGLFYSHAYISAVEELLEIELPENAQYTRVLTMELNRISSHLYHIACFTEALGFKTNVYDVFSLRKEILEILEKITGSQTPCNYYVFGGVREKISNDILYNIQNFINNFNKKLDILNNSIINNPVFIDRTRNVGIITSEIALPYSITGVNLRANGLPFDFRKEKPYLVYDKLKFSIPTAFEGDCHSRYKLRVEEIKVSLSLVNQCAEWLSAEDNNKTISYINQTKIKPKAGRAITWTESPRGLIMCHLVTDGSEKPNRLKWRTPSFYAVQLLENIAAGCTLDDFTTLYGSLDIALLEAER